jgi:hypothetical protein
MVPQPSQTWQDPNIAPVLPEAYGVVTEMWVVMHKDACGVRRIRLMFDHLVASLGKVMRPT